MMRHSVEGRTVRLFPAVCKCVRSCHWDNVAARSAAHKRLDVPRPCFDGHAFLVGKAMSLVHADDSGEAARRVIEQFFDDGQIYSELCAAACERPAQILKNPWGHFRRQRGVEPVLDDGKARNWRATRKREHKIAIAD